MNNFSIVILILYLFSFVTSVIGRYLNITIGNVFAKIIALATFIFATFRPKNFPDLDTYELIFNAALVGDFNNETYWLTHGEPGFKILIYLYPFAISSAIPFIFKAKLFGDITFTLAPYLSISETISQESYNSRFTVSFLPSLLRVWV